MRVADPCDPSFYVPVVLQPGVDRTDFFQCPFNLAESLVLPLASLIKSLLARRIVGYRGGDVVHC